MPRLVRRILSRLLLASAVLLAACQARQAPSPAEARRLEPARAAAEAGAVDQAIELYRSLAEDDMAFAQLELARLLEQRGGNGDLDAAARWYREAAAAGLGAAQLRLATMLERGRGMPADPVAARTWYEAAARTGEVEAETALGRLLEADDPAAAIRHYRSAAERGEVDAQLALARLLGLERGRGPAAAERWADLALADLQQAGAAGDAAAAERLAGLYLDGGLIGADPRVAARWLEVAAEAGSTEARFRLGELLRDGAPGVSPDAAGALRHLGIAAAEGHPGASYVLARQVLAGAGPATDGARAVALLKTAAAGGETRALRVLGDLYADGIHVEPDAAEAIRWYEAAAEAGDGTAALALGRLYERGEGLTADPILALMWYEIASLAGARGAAGRVARLAPTLDPGELQRAGILAADWRRSAGG